LLVDGAGTYDADDEAGRGSVMEQVGGIGTMAGPPARARIFGVVAGRALTKVENAAVESRLMAVETNIFEVRQRIVQ
jgi:hypothetical protein